MIYPHIMQFGHAAAPLLITKWRRGNLSLLYHSHSAFIPSPLKQSFLPLIGMSFGNVFFFYLPFDGRFFVLSLVFLTNPAFSVYCVWIVLYCELKDFLILLTYFNVLTNKTFTRVRMLHWWVQL